MSTWVCIDFETASAADLNKVGAWRYAEDISTFILCLGYKVVVDGVARQTVVIDERDITNKHPELFVLAQDPSVIFVAHNAQFEQAIWKHIVAAQHGWPELPPERWHDTMAVAARRTLPMSLDKVGAILNLNTQKDKEGHRLMLQMCKPNREGNFDHTPEKLARLKQYNVGDVDTQYDLHKRLGGLGASERRIWIQDQVVNQRGILVDVPYVKQCMSVLEQAREPLTDVFKQLTGGLEPTQAGKITEWIRERGVEIPNLRKETLDQILDPENDAEETTELPYEVYRVIELRRMLASSSVKKLNRMLETANLDGRIRGTSQYHGARTGRNAGRLVQPLNMPKPLIKGVKQSEIMALVRAGDIDEINAKCDNAYDAVISTLRGCFRPGDGHVFSAGDFNAIEARVVLALSGQVEVANSFNAEKYSANDPYAKAGKLVGRDRDTGKAIFLGCGFGLGSNGYKNKIAPNEPIEFCETAVQTYRKELAPLVPKLWYGLQKASADAVWCNARKPYEFRGIRYQMKDDFLVCTLPSGRDIYYYQPRKEQDVEPWEGGQVKPGWSFLSFQGKQMRRKRMWHGLATENVVQATARDIMVEAMFRAEDAGLPMVFTVYDELVTEPKASMTDAAEVLRGCMEERSDWVREFQIPIRAECEVLHQYQK